MIRVILEGLLGRWGTAILNFYDAYSLYINLVIVLYGGLVVYSWMNLKNIRRRLVVAILEQLQNIPDLKPDSSPRWILGRIEIPWESALQRSRFPFVAQQTALWPRRASSKVLQVLLPADDMAADALKALFSKHHG
jgi:hypothetical protein